jgi:hypothetical protein
MITQKEIFDHMEAANRYGHRVKLVYSDKTVVFWKAGTSTPPRLDGVRKITLEAAETTPDKVKTTKNLTKTNPIGTKEHNTPDKCPVF